MEKKKKSTFYSFDKITDLKSALVKLTKPQFHKEIFIKFKSKVNLGVLTTAGVYCHIEKVLEDKAEIKIVNEGTFQIQIEDIDFIKFMYTDIPYRFDKE